MINVPSYHNTTNQNQWCQIQVMRGGKAKSAARIVLNWVMTCSDGETADIVDCVILEL